MKERVYKTAVRNTSDLKQRVIVIRASVSENIDETVDQWRKRLRVCDKAKGHHFEHLLN